MNRPGVPQSLRGIPTGYNAQQQPPQQARSVSNRLPSTKLGLNGTGWTFGTGMPLAGAGGGLPSASRQQQMGSNVSFAQSVGGSQPATPLDLSEFPSLSNTSHLASGGQSALWSTSSQRTTMGNQAVIQRGSSNTPLSQQSQQDDMFGTATRMASSQNAFRFGNQANIGQSVQASQPGSIDDFPPLNRAAAAANAAGDIGQDRTGASVMASLGYGAQQQQQQTSHQGASAAAQGGAARGVGNGLLNALSANPRSESRAAEGGEAVAAAAAAAAAAARQQQKQQDLSDSVPSPGGGGGGGGGLGKTAGPVQQSQGGANGVNVFVNGGASRTEELRADYLARAAEEAVGTRDGTTAAAPSSVPDPLAGLGSAERWGLKGLQTLMMNPDYNAAVSGFGLDLNALGVDLGSNEMLVTQVYSLFSGAAPQPAIPKFRLPDCYKVSNVAALETKISSFNEETLMWIFYSCPNDIKQHLAAVELSNRNWRWHKRQQVWLTKDDMMMPQVLSMNHERGFYIVWDTATWRKERTSREITLNYADLDNTTVTAGAAM